MNVRTRNVLLAAAVVSAATWIYMMVNHVLPNALKTGLSGVVTGTIVAALFSVAPGALAFAVLGALFFPRVREDGPWQGKRI